jgi:hypothetical protein
MTLRTKNQPKQTAELCKQHLREKYPRKLGLVQEFIVEIEGPRPRCDLTRWSGFTDIKGIKKRDVPASRDSIRELAQSMTGRQASSFAIVTLQDSLRAIPTAARDQDLAGDQAYQIVRWPEQSGTWSELRPTLRRRTFRTPSKDLA